MSRLQKSSSMKDKVIIRAFNNADKRDLLDIIDQNTPQYFATSERVDFEHYLENELEDYFVVEYQNQVIAGGGINYHYENRKAKISWDLVIPLYHGKGIGKLLLNHRLRILRKDQNIASIQVRTSQLAYQFYAKAGFQLIKKEKDFWAKGFDLYWMEFEQP